MKSSVDNAAFVPGRVYFKAYFIDPHYRYPEIETFVYLGSGTEIKTDLQVDDDLLYFQDARSYATHGRLNANHAVLERDDLIVMSTEQAHAASIYLDLDGLYNMLREEWRASP